MSNRRAPITAEQVTASKKPKIIENAADSIFNKSPSWRFAKADTEHPKWTVLDFHEDVIQDPSDPTGTSILHKFSKSIDRDLINSLSARESTTWGELLTQTGGRSKGTNSHNIAINKMTKDAQDRATELNLVVDGLLSLRLDGTHRIFGLMEDGVFNIVWFDREHEICPSVRR